MPTNMSRRSQVEAVDSIEDARLQAIEYLGFSGPKRVRAGDEIFEIPNPSMLNAEQRQRYNELQFSLEELDRWPDIKNDAGEVIAMGDLKVPHRKNGVLQESYEVRLTKALLGDEAAERFFANGGLPGDVNLFWSEMNQRISDRQQDDSKSVGGAGDLAAVSESDRV